MAIKDVLLSLTSYPDPTPDSSIDAVLAFVSGLGARVTGLTFEAELKMARTGGLLTGMLVDLPTMAAEESAKSAAHAKHLLSYFKASATRQRVPHDHLQCKSAAFEVPAALVEHAKLHDLTIVALQDTYGVEQWHVESVVFGSGRPVLAVPGPATLKGSPSAKAIAVAWDFSRPAARALADSLPLLQSAEQVRLVTVRGEKGIASKHTHKEMAQHLLAHGISAEFDIVEADGRSAAEAVRDYLERSRSTMLVMGAYGHSRIREFVLGGMTRDMLDNPPVPVFLSH